MPVINGLTDLLHPCQVMADIMTVEEHLGTIEDRTVCMVGDGNNLANSWLNAASVFPFNFTLACPEGYEPDESILSAAEAAGASFCIMNDPVKAVEGAHVIYAKSWSSTTHYGDKLGDQNLRNELVDWCVDEPWFANAREDCRFMHCLPVRRNVVVSDGVLNSPVSGRPPTGSH